MVYFADLHVHSRYSRATSKDCTLVELAKWAALKGLRVIASGDFTHPGWFEEIVECLEEAENGLYRLKKDHTPPMDTLPDGFGPGDVRFILNVEISSIYKKDGATRKVHNLIFMPDIESVERFNKRLDKIGNIKSDGRPILGLDSRDLFETALETTSESFLIPAHIWTPWFSLLGSRSGFDSVDHCFGDLTPHIFAMETGLSSDPEMNHRVSALDRYTLISNSDTHSPANLAREANIFDGDPGYRNIRDAIRAARPVGEASSAPIGNDRFVGTLEFFPEEGKYHLDGHRKCQARLEPDQSAKLGNICPVCGHPVTIGVMNRVFELSDRELGVGPENAPPFWRILPMREVLAQSIGVGAQSKKVSLLYSEVLSRLGPELTVLWSTDLEQIERETPKIVSEAIARMRRGELSIKPGYDGEFGSVHLFSDDERDYLLGQETFLPMSGVKLKKPARRKSATARAPKKRTARPQEESKDDPGLNPEQEQAVKTSGCPALVQAGPGTGKTRALTHRIAHLIQCENVAGDRITAVTFTRKAAQEMKERLNKLLPESCGQGCWVGTFHQLGMRLLETLHDRGVLPEIGVILDEDGAFDLFKQAFKEALPNNAASDARAMFRRVSLLKQDLQTPPENDADLSTVYTRYAQALESAAALDLDDIIVKPLRLMLEHPGETETIRGSIAERLLVDEFQDVNRCQYELVRLLAGQSGEGLFAIGDPNQAIYGFRGSDRRFFQALQTDFPSVKKIHLNRNYRSTETIVEASNSFLGADNSPVKLRSMSEKGDPIHEVRLASEKAEGAFITQTIDSMLGGSSFFSIDSGRADGATEKLGFGDFAVVYRLNAVGDALEKQFQASGIPYQRARRQSPKEEAEALDPRASAVTLMTIHAAKGLEFPVVFVAGCEEGIMPYIPPGGRKETDLDEEGRLFFVALTRAGKRLFLTRSRKRNIFGVNTTPNPSPFLEQVASCWRSFHSPRIGKSRVGKEGPVQCELFS